MDRRVTPITLQNHPLTTETPNYRSLNYRSLKPTQYAQNHMGKPANPTELERKEVENTDTSLPLTSEITQLDHFVLIWWLNHGQEKLEKYHELFPETRSTPTINELSEKPL